MRPRIAAAASANERTRVMLRSRCHDRSRVIPCWSVGVKNAQRAANTVRSPSPVDLVAMTDRAAQHGISYASAGVDIEAGDRAVELFKPLASKATRPEVRGGLGGFAGLFALRGGYREPVLASARPTASAPSSPSRRRWTSTTPSGLDLVAMVVDDLVVCGAEPLFLQDYIAVGRTVPERVSRIGRRHRQRLRDRGLCAARRRDRRTPRADGARPLRHLGDRRRHRGGRRRARSRPGQARRRDHRDGLDRPALQRLLAGSQGAAGDRPDEPGRARRGVRPHAGRGAARADPHLRQGLPGAGRRDPGAHVLPRHRRRAGRQPGTRHPARG